MKKILILNTLVLALLLGSVRAADSVEPATITFNLSRSDTAESFVSASEYYKNASLRFTNCVLYTTGTVVQALSDVTLELKFGTSSTNLTYTPTVTSTNLGKWTLDITVPTNFDAPYMQMKITDVNTNSYIYPWRRIHTKASL